MSRSSSGPLPPFSPSLSSATPPRGSSQLPALLANFSYILDIAAFAIILPGIAASLNIGADQALLLFAAYGVSLSATLLLGGLLIDRSSLKLIFLAGLSIYTAAAALIAVAPTFELVLLLRAAQGVGAGIFSPCVPLIIAACARHGSARGLTMWGVWSGIFAALSPLAIVLATSHAGADWRLAWLVVPTTSLIAIAIGLNLRADAKISGSSGPPATGAPAYYMFAYVFLSYGVTSWFIYNIPLRAAVLYGLDDIGSATFSTLLWLTFSLTCLAMARSVHLPMLHGYLLLSAALLVAGTALFFVTPWCALFVGAAMALANMPTTEIILANARRGAFGLSASFDIVCARLGGALLVVLVPAEFPGMTIAMMAISATLAALALMSWKSGTRTAPATLSG